jgi:hypothetical protein
MNDEGSFKLKVLSFKKKLVASCQKPVASSQKQKRPFGKLRVTVNSMS